VNDGEGVYEVTLRVDRAIAADYLAWLRAHIVQVLALPGFVDARLYAIDVDVVADDECIGWCVHYRLRDRAALESYLHEHAPQMRAEGLARFGTRFRAERRILHVLGDD
jgi:hypothetical protein